MAVTFVVGVGVNLSDGACCHLFFLQAALPGPAFAFSFGLVCMPFVIIESVALLSAASPRGRGRGVGRELRPSPQVALLALLRMVSFVNWAFVQRLFQ